jgi:hypothetical protein
MKVSGSMDRKSGWVALAAGVAIAAGCGGGGGSSGGAAVAPAGVTSGTITGFGSVIVNGVRYRTSGSTQFDIDDGPGGQDDLAVGQQVTVRWSSSDGGLTFDATIVEYDDTLEGPIAANSIDLAAGTFVVLGQLVKVTTATSFDDGVPGRSLAGLVAGDRVEVSGLIDADGIVQATRIEIDDDSSEDFEVRGVVTGLDPVNRTFVINSLTIDYSAVPGTPAIADGDLVEVEGDTFDGSTLVASRIEREGDDDLDDGDGEVEVEGYVTAFTSTADFAVNGRRVTTGPRTRYEDGTAADLALNARVEVEGRLDAGGILIAETVEFRNDVDDDGSDGPGRAEIEDVITAIPSPGTVVAGGVTITTTARTRFEDHGDDDDQFLNAAALRVGDFIEVRGVVLPGNIVEAVILERDDPGSDASLRGPVTQLSEPSLSILGVAVDTDAGTDFEVDDNDVDATTFFGSVAVGSEVKGKFAAAGTSPRIARELELELDSGDDDDSDDDSDDSDDDGDSSDD